MSLFRTPVLMTTLSFVKDAEKLTSVSCGQRSVSLSSLYSKCGHVSAPFTNEREGNNKAVLKKTNQHRRTYNPTRRKMS